MVTLGSRKGLREILEESDHASFITTHQQTKPTSSGIKVRTQISHRQRVAELIVGDPDDNSWRT